MYRCSQRQDSMALHRKMQEERSSNVICPNSSQYMALLKSCAKAKDLQRGIGINAEMARVGIVERYIVLSNALVDMYWKCGSLSKSREVFDTIQARDVVSWNSLLYGLSSCGHGEAAINLFERMRLEGLFPDAITFVCIFKSIGHVGATGKSDEICAEVISRKELLENSAVSCALINMYVKMGSLPKAQEVLDKLTFRNVSMWTALIGGYAEHGHGHEALFCFEKMIFEGICPDSIAFVLSLKACGIIVASEKGLEMHAEIEKRGLVLEEVVIGNSLLDMYVKCFPLIIARHVFDRLPIRDVVSWNTLLTGYVEQNHVEEVMNCFETMQADGIFPNVVTYTCILKACGAVGAVDEGRMIHEETERKGLVKKDHGIGIALVDLYAKCGWLTQAQHMFDRLRDPDVIAWNVLIAAYAENGRGEEALECYRKMELQGIPPDVVTFLYIVKACGSVGAIEKGCLIHAEIERIGLIPLNIRIGVALVDMYAKCGWMHKASELFSKLPLRNVVSWTALIAGYAGNGRNMDALDCFDQMQLEGIAPNLVTSVCCLSACNHISAELSSSHEKIPYRTGLLDMNLIPSNSVVNMYSKRGLFGEAREVLDQIPVRDVVSWNALISGYSLYGYSNEVFNCLEQMHLEGISSDMVTFISVLKVCALVGAISKGQEIHLEIERKGFLECDVVLGSTLINMYARCGMLAKAQDVFDKLQYRNVVSWNVLIAGYGQQGDTGSVFSIFKKMLEDGIEPDQVTFVIVLAACNHAGLFGQGQTYFDAMRKDYGVVPILEHHSCMVDRLGRAGQLDEAIRMIKEMPIGPNVVVWHSLLGACNTWGNVTLGRKVFETALNLDTKDAASYVLMSKICADA